MPIYRRGAIYWWRRNLPCSSGETRHIMVRVSLRTASAGEARVRGASLELEWHAVVTSVDVELKRDLAREDLSRIYHSAYKARLDRIIVKQAATPMQDDGHAGANLLSAHFYTHLARHPTSSIPTEQVVEQLVAAGMNREWAWALHLAMQLHRKDEPLTRQQVDAYLREADAEPTTENVMAVGRVVAAAYRNACLESSDAIGKPIAPGTIEPLPGSLLRLLGVEAPAHDRPVASVTAATTVAAANAPVGLPAVAPSPPPADLPQPDTSTDIPISRMAALVIEKRVESGAWDPDRKRDIDAVVTLFIAANGDIGFGTISQTHLSAMTELFSRLPTRYGFAKKDKLSGEWTQETIAEALARGSALKAQWSADPVSAERAGIATVGFGAVTRKKHLTWFGSLVAYAEGAGLPYPVLNITALRKEATKDANSRRVSRNNPGKKKNAALPAFAPEDLRHLFTAPIWSGCGGLWDRFSPGNVVIHDAWYWSPLGIGLTACRSSEWNGLATDDVDIDAPTPYVHFRVNCLRRVKTAASDRKVPIASILIKLGFLDYVRAMRALGHRAVFPELVHPSLSFDHVFYDKIFEPLLDKMFPRGTGRKVGEKDVDVRSIRSACISHLRNVGCAKDIRESIVGHESGDTHSDIYEEDPDPALLLPWVDRLSELLPPLVTHPLTLRPAEWQKFGAPRGRPRS